MKKSPILSGMASELERAKQPQARIRGSVDCFASLAMTVFVGVFVAVGVSVGVAAFAASTARAADTFKYGVVEAKGDAGILFMPAKFGPKYGIDIQMVQFASSNTPLKALISGDIDAFATTPSVPLTALGAGAKVKFVGCNWPGATYALYTAADITSIAQLKGKSIAVSGPGSMPDLFARVAIQQGGLKPNQVVFANSGGGSDRFKALAAGVVKATATSTEFAPEAEKRGLHLLVSANTATPNFARNCIVTSDRVIATRRDALVRFLAATIDGTGFAMSHRAETVALSREAAKLAPEDTSPEFIFDEATAQHSVDPQLAMDKVKLQWVEDQLAANDAIDEAADVAKYIDDAPRQDALKLVKP